MSWQARLPPSVNDLLRRLDIDPAICARSDGRFTIEVGDCGMVDLVPTDGNRLVLDALIARADRDSKARRAQTEKVLKFAASRMRHHFEIAALSDDGESFRLQTYVEAALSPVEIEDALGDFLNAIVAWRAMLYGSPAVTHAGLRGLP